MSDTTSYNQNIVSQEQLIPGSIIGQKYRLVQTIGKGGMHSVIWKAEVLEIANDYEANFRRYRAVKIISLNFVDTNDEKAQKKTPIKRQELIDKINREITVTKRAKYKSKAFFCEIYDWFWLGNNQDFFCIVMELVDGVTLSEYLQTKGMIPVIEAMDIYEKIILAIKSLHQMNQDRTEVILHRDLKLENVMLTQDCSRIKIIDFGVATVLDNSEDRSFKLDEKNIYGTKGYLPPDVKKAQSSVDSKEKAKIINEFWDIFAAAVILYRLITSEPPYVSLKSDKGINDIYFKPERYDFQTVSSYVPETSPIIENIIYRSLVSFPNEIALRYENVDQVLADIQTWKTDPDNRDVTIIKPDSERKIEKIEKLLTLEAPYEVSSLIWMRSLLTYGLAFFLIILTTLLICLI